MNKILDLPILTSFKKVFKGEINNFRIVGGAVRSLLLNQEISDIDIATSFNPEELAKLAAEKNLKLIPTGINYGTQTLILAGGSLEITSLRSDIETDGRHALVRFSEDWQEDSLRRDFTINAIYLDFNGHLHDFHNGQQDLEDRQLKFIGDPESRIKEDYLRILRLFRFYAQLEDFQIEPASFKAAIKLKQGLEILSAERVNHELSKLLKASNFYQALKLISETNLLDFLFTISKSFLESCKIYQSLNKQSPGEIILLANILDKNWQKICKEKLKLSNQQISNIKFLKENHQIDFSKSNQIKKALFLYGREKARLLYLDQNFNNDYQSRAEIIDLINSLEVPVFPVTGKDLKNQGFKEGQELGQELERLKQEWLESNFT